jgi:hypothetical protein
LRCKQGSADEFVAIADQVNDNVIKSSGNTLREPELGADP